MLPSRMISRRGARNLATTAANLLQISGREPKFYGIKDQVDRYVYSRSLPKKWKPMVYRPKNAELLTAMDAVDPEGRPIVPRTSPGTPSKVQFVHFIDGLLIPAELEAVRQTLLGLDKHASDFLTPSVINAFLYKSCEFGIFSQNLTFVYNLNNYRYKGLFGPRNIEGILLIRTVQARKQQLTDLDWYYSKLHHVFKHNKSAVADTMLIHAAKLAMFTQLQINRTATKAEVSAKNQAILSKKIANEVEIFTAKYKSYKTDVVTEMLRPAENFDRWQHAYSILKLVSENAAALPEDLKLAEVAETIEPFLKHVEKLGEAGEAKQSTLDRLLSKAQFEGTPKEAAAEAASQAPTEAAA